MSELTITKENFEAEVLKSDKTVLLDFWAPWCGPCKMLAPVLAEFAEEHPEIKVGKMNVDEEGEFSTEFGVMSIPTLVVFKEGKMIKSSVGFTTKENLENLVK